MTSWHKTLTKNFRRIDLLLLSAVLLLTAVGITMISSVIFSEWRLEQEVQRQLVALGLGVVAMTAFTFLDYRFWQKYSWLFYVLTLVGLIAVTIAGVEINGAQRWILLPGLGSVQPSEFAKLWTPLTISSLIVARPPHSFGNFLTALSLALIPTVMIALQPDFGTAVSMLVPACCAIWVAGSPLKRFIYSGLAGGIAAPFILKPYQIERLTSFLNPDLDREGAGWNVIQSKIAVGSGLWSGKGLFGGSQTKLQFVPEQQTDFIFSVVGEELGFIGVSLTLGLLFLVIHRALRIAESARDHYGRILATAIACHFGIHMLINVGMILGVTPATGLPLPFLSYGGTALIVNCSLVGILLSIYNHRRYKPQYIPQYGRMTTIQEGHY